MSALRKASISAKTNPIAMPDQEKTTMLAMPLGSAFASSLKPSFTVKSPNAPARAQMQSDSAKISANVPAIMLVTGPMLPFDVWGHFAMRSAG